MSHDQRPGRMRVVQDSAAAGAGGRRRADPTTIQADANSYEVVGGAGGVVAAGNGVPGKAGLPLLPAALFLLACAAGGALVAVVRPLGLG